MAHPIVQTPRRAYAQQEYATGLLVLRETLAGFARHNSLSLSASLAFYAMFALIPLTLLIFFLLSHLVFSSDYTIVKLAILMGNLVPDFSSNIMVEVYNASNTGAAWGVVGLLLLLWSITPLASAMRSSFYTIAARTQAPSFLTKKIQDVATVLGMLLLLLLFTAAGFALEKMVHFLATHVSATQLNIIGALFTLVLTTLLIALFYRLFLPFWAPLPDLLTGALITACLWLLMRPAFAIFLSVNQQYGAIFGSMKALFISITWIYINFAIFLLGTELIVTMRKKDMLLLKRLFDGQPNSKQYLEALVKRYGRIYQAGDTIMTCGSQSDKMYYLVEGEVQMWQKNQLTRTLRPGDYFGEIAMLSGQPADMDAVVRSAHAQIIVIYAENIDSILREDPHIARQLLTTMARNMKQCNRRNEIPLTSKN